MSKVSVIERDHVGPFNNTPRTPATLHFHTDSATLEALKALLLRQ
jgi:hypothetical protein